MSEVNPAYPPAEDTRSGRSTTKDQQIMADSLSPQTPSAITLPDELAKFCLREGNYQIGFAKTLCQIDAALRLRFEVFNLELGEGLENSFETGRDRDEFDEQCHHLIVTETGSGEVIATYRMQTREMADAGRGFYSQAEFKLEQFPDAVLNNAVEVGRACISKAYRNGRVLFLLWKGIAGYMTAFQKRYLFGCCSLTSQDPLEGEKTMHYLRRKGLVQPHYEIFPQPDFLCYQKETLTNFNQDIKLPRLFRIYMNYHARVCGPPAIDRRFKTIDFLVLLDLHDLDFRTRNMFF